MVKCDVSGLRQLRLNLKAGGLVEDCAKILAERALSSAAGRTPVRTGNLRRGFSADTLVAVRTGDAVRIEILNPVEYGSFVEFGHRTRGGRGWAPGRFMLTLALSETELAAPLLLRARIREFLEGCFADG